MQNGALGAVATVFGVILGFVLSQAAEYYKPTRNRKKARKSVRLLLLLEVKKNYRLLSIYWHGLSKSVTKEQGREGKIPPSSYAHAIVDTAFPVFSRSGWNALFEKIPESFSAEEITHIWDFYEDLLQLAKLHADISDLRRNSEAKVEAAEAAPLIGRVVPHGEFLEKAEGPADDFIRIIKGIMDYGGMQRIFSVEDKDPLLD